MGTRARLDLQSVFRLTELADYVVSFCIRTACDLSIADQLIEGPKSVDALAAATGSDVGALHRILRALACKGIFTEVEPGRYGLSPLAEPLRSDHPLSLKDAYPLLAADVQAWANFDYSVRTGKPAFDHVHGQGLWEYFRTHPEDSVRFDRGMAAMSRSELRAVLPAYNWADLGTVVDVGGGNGAFLAGLLARNPALKGVLFDMPHVVAGAGAVLSQVADRCQVISGSFFDGIPSGGDAYVMKRILYGWDDERAVGILRKVAAAMSPSTRLLVLEPTVLPGDGFQLAKILDVVMLAVDGGHARTPEELDVLFARAGLRRTALVPTFMFAIVEVRRA